MSADTTPRLFHIMRAITGYHLPEVLAYILAVGSAGMGFSFIVRATAYLDEPTYDIAQKWAPIATWGALLVVCAILLFLLVVFRRKDSYWPSLLLTLIYGGFTLSTTLSLSHGGIPSSVWGYLILTALSGVLTMVLVFSEDF